MATLDDDDKRWIARTMGEALCALAFSLVDPSEIKKAERVALNLDHLPEFRRLRVRMVSEEDLKAQRIAGKKPA